MNRRAGARAALRREYQPSSAADSGLRPVPALVEGATDDAAANEAPAVPPALDAAWAFLTLHSQVLLGIVRRPHSTVEEIARGLGIGRRTAHRVLHELEDAGYLRRGRCGKRNTYHIEYTQPLRHPLTRHREIGDLLAFLMR